MTRSSRTAAWCVCLLLAPLSTEAASLKVAPARFIVHNVTPGALYDICAETGLRLTIYNDDDAARTWVLSVHRPSDRGSWEMGYAEIPDPSWCWFDQAEVTVEPQGKEYAHLFLQVPDEERYYNQHWVVTLGIDGKPGRGGIALAADVRAQIETKSKADAAAKPDGPLGVAPSIVRFENAVPGAAAAATVMLYNNGSVSRTYAVSRLFDDAQIEQKTYLTHGFERIPAADWLRCEQTVQIAPGGSAIVPVSLNLPADTAPAGGKWEELLLIQPQEGRAGFVRIQIETREEPKTAP